MEIGTGGVARTLGRRWPEAGHAVTRGVGVNVEFHLRPGVLHEFETFANATDVAHRAVSDRLRVLRAL